MNSGEDRVAVVTGGSRGIGRATAISAAGRGWRTLISYVSDEASARETVAAVEAAGGMARAVRCDIGVEADCEALFREADDFGILGALVNNAGIVDLICRVEDMSVARVERILRVNVIGNFVCSREAVRRMSTRHGGRGGVIVNLSSIVARTGAPNAYVDYAASKAAIDALTVGLAQEVAAEGIRVVSVRPGLIDTEIHAASGDADRHHRLSTAIPMQRVGEADEVAGAVTWLMSDEASYITGTTLDVSGGR